MRQSKSYKQSEWLVEGPEEMASLKADQAREIEDLKRRHEGEVEALKMKHERESDRQSKKDEAEAEREAQSESLEEGKLVADDLMIIKSIADNIAKEMEKRVEKNRESGINFINQLIRSAGMKKTVSGKGQRKGHLFLRQGDNISEDYGRGNQKGVANIRGTSYFDSAVGAGWESALKDLLRGHITQREFEKAFPALTKKDFEPLLKSKEVKDRSQRYGVSDRDYKKKISQLVKEDKEEQDRDIKDKEGTQPKKYHKGLDKKTKEKRDAHFKKGKTGPAPGDSDAESKPSTHTKKYKAMYGEDADKGLENKAKKSGIPKGILKKVYDRGLAAYKSGHRPGATAPQWAMARVNSFITKGKGTWGGADKDLAKQVSEKLDKNSDAGDYVKDFRKSDAPQFKGKTDKKIRQMAIAAFLDKKKG